MKIQIAKGRDTERALFRKISDTAVQPQQVTTPIPDRVLEVVPHSLLDKINGVKEKAYPLWARLVQIVIQSFIRLVLKPRSGKVGTLDQSEVDEVYNKEARRYDSLHHLTTHGQDTTWRRQAGFHLLGYVRRNPQPHVQVLDLCTGTGLTVAEMIKVTEMHRNLPAIIITGIDYNQAMLNRARHQESAWGRGKISTQFRRGDATQLHNNRNPDFASVPQKSIDFVSHMFGIGGIKDPQPVLEQVLTVLKDGGEYFLTDMHSPMKELPGEFFFLGWRNSPVLERCTYEATTIPLALKRLWGWRDTTWDFYLIPLTVIQDDSGQWWGFEVIHHEVTSLKWWGGIPVMPVARSLARKVKIERDEALVRREALSWLHDRTFPLTHHR